MPKTSASVLVAWNHSREAMRAIRGALPLLTRAEQVVVLDGTPQGEELVVPPDRIVVAGELRLRLQ